MGPLRVPVVRVTPETFAGLGQVVFKPTDQPTVTRPGLRFWSRVAAMDIPGEVEMGVLELTAQDFVFDSLERHVRTPEMFIPLQGVAIMPIGLGSGADGFPRPEEIKGFLIDSETSIIMNPGVWHWIPYPLSPVASYLIPALVGTPTEDREVRLLAEPLRFEI
jgi:ureidoglycolate hydrolase